ncbi:hypothetical protein PHYBLDRAFT_69548 [Phycomyces blakesleeanus NRRL 1555(-)]|uniref:Calcium-activated potassium channel BK alpha subunit domain-containing protein n=1 Tax=Phycomyces blakesleeanus (strain ATCC 8743b / DSM 1359 / FGSC 10004 / NBRC 33097 / NRRL 1555) TaxID=763407 RepID=A0A167LJV3_PHYB8|nr:hypothetical protein PHYBLDRAFT_69548 [Phycomyces blakesleeanus NRRL 1555(-)]OAD70616.1 hypothetical protein PHYBLDRAFT_69548 [Phycomyces blakesleeanus NRRL 1555(-)]|eukprot:XP_018288656.1 hypothetical protein PHYBLDRAFT_69548 [Phycomyces blakesleeanus NRRL 1555(-)]
MFIGSFVRFLLCGTCVHLEYASFFMTGHPLSVFFSFRACIEATTTLPFLVSNFIEYGQFLYVPYFLRSWVLLLRIKSAMKIRTNLQMTDKPVDPLNTKLIHLIGTLIVLLYNGMSAFQYCEVTFGSNNYTILESLYVVMVTLSTVGYGDITPNTQASRIIMMALIVISLAVLPSLITGVLDTLRKQSDGGGHVGRGAIPFILIVGSFTTEQAIAILDGFLNVENAESHLSVIFLDNNPPTEELKLMERNSMWGHRVQFLHGSVLSDDTLKRVQARYAKAIFTVSDQHAADPGKEDERNTVRLWSIFCYTVSNNVPIYTYNLSPSTAVYQKVAKEVICVREFKQYLLAMNCRCRGASTLMTNLLHQREPMNVYDEPWQAQFDDGSCNEIYMERPIDCFIGRNFGHVSWLLFKECQIILFAIKTRVEETDDCEILLNPCNNYIIKHDDICVYIAESPKERPDYVAKVIDSLKFNRNRYKNEYVPNADMQLPNDTIKEKQQQQKQQPPPPPPSSSLGIASGAVGGFQFQLKLPKLPARPSMAQRSTPSYDSFSSYQWTGGSTQQNYRILKLPPDRHAMITGRRAMIARLGHTSSSPTEDTSLPQCYLLDESPKLSDVMITDTNTISGHVLVCLHREVINIFKFVYNMRSPTIKPEDLQDIVLLCQKQPKAKTFDLISMFPRVFFMVGNCRHPDDLLRAGVKRAKQVVVMSEKECLDQYERNSDSPAVMTSHILDLLLQERPKDSYTIVNLVEKSNIKYMHLLQGKDVAEEIDVFYTPAYAAGDVVADSLISNVLLSQTYYKPDIVSVLKSLCGMPCPTYDPSPGQISNDSTTTGGGPDVTSSSSLSSSSSSDRMKSQFLSSILLPQVFVGKSFACLFETLLLDYDVLPIGLLRATDEIFGNELPFVYANPVPSLILKETDMVYILASPGWSFD